MIYIITGRSGSGKTEKLHSFIAAMPEGKKAILIVPEQSSYYNEKKLLEKMGAKKAGNIEVLSFRRLCSNIFDKYKGISQKRIDDGIKAVLMSIAIENAPSEGGELELYGAGKKGRKTADLIEPMLTAVNEYKLCMISPEMLSHAAKAVNDNVLSAKLRDSARIYAAYNALLENSYDDPDDDLARLYEILGEHDEFCGISVFIDSFSGFSAQEMKVIGRVFSQADDVFVTVCCDRKLIGNENSVFKEANETYRSLLREASKAGRECHIEEQTAVSIRYKSNNIRALEKYLFSSYRRGAYDEVPAAVENDGTVEMYEAADMYDEIQHTAQQIYRLVSGGKMRFSDIEIIARSIDGYKNIIYSEFPKYDIPYFISDPESLELKPLIRLILLSFDAVHKGLDTEAILSLAKTGMTELEDEEIYLLENYCYVWDIRGKRWRKPFTMAPDGMRRTNDDSGVRAEIDNIEEIRKKLTAPLFCFENELEEARTGGDICKSIYRLIVNFGCREKLRKLIRIISDSEGVRKAEREASVWDMTMSILEKLYDVLENRAVDSRSFLELLRLYVRKTPVSDIPQTINSVTVGVAGTIRSQSPKAVFVLGAVEGEFPAQPGAVGIFTDSERRFLRDEQPEELCLPLYDSIYGTSLKEKMNAYMALCAPSERLFISWHTQDLSGKGCEPSVIKNEIEKIIKGIRTEHTVPVTESLLADEQIVFTERQCFDVCASLWNSGGARSSALKKYYLESEKYSDRTRAVQRSSRRDSFRLEDLSTAKRLYGSPLRLSSTKLDKFAGCKFSYFCSFGLDAQPLRKSAMDNGLYGTAMHYIFEKLLGNIGIDSLMKMNENKITEEINKACEMYLDEIGDKAERSSRFRAIFGKIRRNALRVILRMCRQFEGDKFRPVDFELRIGGKTGNNAIPSYELELPTGDRICINGFVDRVDTADIGDKKYIRIIDYKTGSDQFEMSNIANGIKVQMLLYLSAILKYGAEKYSDGKVMLPAGVLYVPSTSKASVGASLMEKTVEEKLGEQNNNFKMKGLLINDKGVLSAMEEGLEGNFIPASVNKRPPNELSSRSSVVSSEQFDEIFRYIDICIKKMGIELYSGNIEAKPGKNACKYCNYSSVCRFEKGSRTVKLPKYSKDQAMNVIEAELKKEEGDSGEH